MIGIRFLLLILIIWWSYQCNNEDDDGGGGSDDNDDDNNCSCVGDNGGCRVNEDDVNDSIDDKRFLKLWSLQNISKHCNTDISLMKWSSHSMLFLKLSLKIAKSHCFN